MTIKEIRKASGMTQAAFASYIGVAKRTLEGWEHGRTCPEYIRALIEYKLRKEHIIMEINIYFVQSNGVNSIIFENAGRWFAAADDGGCDIDTGVDLYSNNAVPELRNGYADLEFNPFDENYEAAVLKGDDFQSEIAESAENVVIIRTVVE